MRLDRRLLVLLGFLSLGVAACGGGGSSVAPSAGGTAGGSTGSSSSGASSTPTPSPKPSATATATPSPSPTPTAAGVTFNGTVTDFVTGASVPNVSLTINSVSGTTTVAEARAPLGVRAPHSTQVESAPLATGRRVLSTASGAFTFTAPPGVLVSIAATAPGYAPSVNGYTTPASSGSIRPIVLVPLTADISGWLALANSDRAANGDTTPLTIDNELTIAAMTQAADEDTYMYAGHWNHLGQSAEVQCSLAGALFCAQNGGGGAGSTYQSIEAAYMAEKANCPGGVVTGCPYADNTGHFINLVGATSGIIGLGIATSSTDTGFTMNIASARGVVFDPTTLPTGKSGQPVSVAFRTITSAGIYANVVYETTCPWQMFTGAQLAATSPGTPYPASCAGGTEPSVTLTQSKTDPALFVGTFTPPTPGVYLIGIASGSAWVGSAPINVPN